jgi:alpha-1,3-rhamnosyl/mannosyltransferase
MVMTVHDCILERYPQYVPSAALRRMYAAQTQLSVRRANAVLTVSEATRQDVRRFYPEAAGKLRVIGGAVDARFQPVHDAAVLEEVRRRYRLPERFVLTVGAGRPHKNVGMVVEAMARLDRAYAPALVVAGEPDERFPDEVMERARVRGLGDRIVRAGFVRDEDLPALYSLAEVFVFPSLVEGYGLPPLEAMACGTPVVASNASSIPEVVGDAALSFDPEDVSQLARHIARLLSDSRLRADLVARGEQRAAEMTWDRVAQETLAAYAALLPAPERVPLDASAESLPSIPAMVERSASPAQRPRYAAA